MDDATPKQPSPMPRRKGPPAALRITTPQNLSNIAIAHQDQDQQIDSLSSATSDSDSFVFPPPSKSRSRNMKKLSLTLFSAQSSALSLAQPSQDQPSLPPSNPNIPSKPEPRRRPSVISLPNSATPALLHRKDEDLDGSPTVPYMHGPIQILPKIWLGSEDNVRDWRVLIDRGIRSVLNVAKEVNTSFDTHSNQPLRPFMSTPDLNTPVIDSVDPTYYPAHIPTGRPSMHYLKLPWSHGQSDLVRDGFPAAMRFVDQALERGEGVLIHCQCGVSRSATLAIALVMRAAAQCSPSVPSEVWALKGMQGAYSYVKDKSKWVGPNMSLIYQLLDYERSFKAGDASPYASDRSSVAAEEEEWSRRRLQMEEAESEENNDRESVEVMREARALDKAMEDRLVARKSSTSSLSSNGGLGMGPAWRNRYATSRKRTGSIASIVTDGSVLSEHLLEEDEEQHLLGLGGGFTSSSADPTEDEASSESSGDPNSRQTSPSQLVNPHLRSPSTARMPPSAPAHKNTFVLPPVPATATRATFDIPPLPSIKTKLRRRPPPLVGILPPVPPSPITPKEAVVIQVTPAPPAPLPAPTVSILPPAPQPVARPRNEGRKPELPPLQLRKSASRKPPALKLVSSSSSTSIASSRSSRSSSTSTVSSSTSSSSQQIPLSATPCQTLFVFPPSPTSSTSNNGLLMSRTPSTMTLTSSSSFPFPTITTPRVSTFRGIGGKPRSFIGLGVPATPTTASSRVDARGWVGLK